MELTPEGHPPHRPARARRPVPRLLQDRAGRHEIERSGHRPRTRRRAQALRVRRPVPPRRRPHDPQRDHAPGRGHAGAHPPDDFEIERTEQITRTATVLMLDVSLSMEMRGRFLAAKKVAMALHALISSQFPRDYLGMVSFGRVAREVKPERLPEATWDFEWGTNMQHAMMLARAHARRQDRPQADHHDHRRRTDRPHPAERRSVLRLPARRRARSR